MDLTSSVIVNHREADPAMTATAAMSAKPVAAAESLGTTLGRYRLERELGAGTMGVVHAAFDPDLERRIALKVLRRATATSKARERLLREARTMARLTHPNVVTVYEVGTVNGRDFIAMELISGGTLAEWLRQAGRPPAAILDAFLDAGRGLAAAHAAGIVHRDFKPRNVLRGRDGRIVVTDFGLAREVEIAPPLERDATPPSGVELVEPTPLVGLTAPGSVVGTPAYMSPEQWSGGAVSPATDQFAYCVALWEALAGERPYRGPTLDDLRRQIAAGPTGLDASRIPRRVRGLLRRGMDPDPARRWPSMDALLAKLARARRVPRPGIMIGRVGVLVTVTTAVIFEFLAWRASDKPQNACDPPVRDVATVWSPEIAAELRQATSDAHAAVLDSALRDWQTARTAACAAPPQVRQAQLQCLNGVLGRFDALRQAFARVPGSSAEDLQMNLVDPVVCRKPEMQEVPRLTIAPTADVIAAYVLLARSSTEVKPSEREFTGLTDTATADPCARSIAILAFDAASADVPRQRALMKAAAGVADRCGDDRLRADLLIRDISYHRELPIIGPEGEAAIERAQSAAERVMQAELAAQLAAQRGMMAGERDHWDEAFRWLDSSLATYRARGLPSRQVRAVIARNFLRILRTRPDDLEAISGEIATWRPIAVANHQIALTRQLDVLAVVARYRLNDVSAHDDLLRLWRDQPRSERSGGSRKVSGEVVDSRGRPVAGATVAAARTLYADSVGIGVPLFSQYNEFRDDSLRITTSDTTGHFVIEDATPVGAIGAQHADLRSQPIAIDDHVTLVLAPTRSISGKVELGGTPFTHVRIICAPIGEPTRSFSLSAPVARDGSFILAGAPVGALSIGASARSDAAREEHVEYRTIPPSPAAITGLALDITGSTRTIDIILHSAVDTPLSGVTVTLLTGRQTIGRMGDNLRSPAPGRQFITAKPVVGKDYPRPVLDRLRPGDLVAHVEHAPLGELTVCATSWAGDPLDPQSNRRVLAHFPEFVVKCKSIGSTIGLVELDVPPQPHFD